MSNTATTPTHVVIIPDGNRRWATAKGLDPWEGHEYGAKNIEDLVRTAHEAGIRCLSLWGSSLENLQKRPLQEKEALLDIYERYFIKLIDGEDIHKNEVRINVIGRWEEQFPEKLKSILHKGMERTRDYKKHILNFCLAYSGDDDMLCAIQTIAQNYSASQDVTPDVIKKHLMTHDLPPVDYMIRTGGEPHLSAGFMMWDMANAQLHFSQKLFPDFGSEEFKEALVDYQNRGRRLGK